VSRGWLPRSERFLARFQACLNGPSARLRARMWPCSRLLGVWVSGRARVKDGAGARPRSQCREVKGQVCVSRMSRVSVC
jgi:hypothetical protein